MSRPTPELKAAIVADRKAGMTGIDVAEKYGVSASSVKRWYQQAREAEGIDVKRIKRPKYTEEQRRHILDEHYASGRSVNASAQIHGMSHQTLGVWIRADDAWRDDTDGADMSRGEWVLCPRRRIQVWRAA